MADYPLWVWPTGKTSPVLAGIFAYENGRGSFVYDQAYLDREDRTPLDPVDLPLKRARIQENNQEGIFGVIRDSGPDSWGRLVIKHQTGEEPSDIDAILQSPGDGAGSIVLGDIERKLTFTAPDAVLISKVAEYFQKVESDHFVEEVPADIAQAIKPGTSLGGAKPKITVEDDGALWIAKFPERGDSPYIACFESAMLKLSQACGIRSCESKTIPVDDNRYAIMVKRFDRERHDDGWMRHGFASAHTALQLKKDYHQDKRRSYPNLAFQIGRWCSYAGYEAQDQKQELWKRMVFNALIGNGDDHPRNHAFICKSGNWQLAPAFDLVPAKITRDTFALSMPLQQKRDGTLSSLVTVDALLSNVGAFALKREEAISILEKMAETVREGWREAMSGSSVPDNIIDSMQSAFCMGERLVGELKAVDRQVAVRKLKS